jgi:hypothetical protein
LSCPWYNSFVEKGIFTMRRECGGVNFNLITDGDLAL